MHAVQVYIPQQIPISFVLIVDQSPNSRPSFLLRHSDTMASGLANCVLVMQVAIIEVFQTEANPPITENIDLKAKGKRG